MKYIANFFRKQRMPKGDTIIEVMISLVVLSMVLATVYAMGSRSLRTGTEANQRTEALTAAQSQVDLLINAKNIDPNFATNYQVAQAFCLNPDGTKNTSAQANANKLCNGYNGSQYNIGVSYSSNLFIITAQWPSPDAPNGTANLNLYYKLPGTYKKALVSAGSASIAGTTATVNGTVNPNGNIITDCYFEYDTTTSYTAPKRVNCSSSPGSGNSAVAVSAVITGLDTDKVYFFRLCATNIVGTACSDNNGTFTTPAAPSIINQSATDYETPSGNNANLNAQVNPNGTLVTDCHFEWGLTNSYGNNTSCGGGSVGSGNSFVAVSANIAPLTANATYHFRLVATNSAGTKQGPDSTFIPIKAKTPEANLSASPTSVTYNTASELSWTSKDATSCTGNGFSTGPTSPTSGRVSTGPLTSPKTYSVTCSRLGVSTTSLPVTVNVKPTASLSTSPSSIGYGSSSTITWNSTNATSCSGSNFSTGGSVRGGPITTGALYSSTSYSVTCTGPGGSASASASVSVAAPPPPPPPPNCTSTAGGFYSGGQLYISGGGGGCAYWYDTLAGWNGTFGQAGPVSPPGCHTQNGGVDPWGWLSSASWGC